MTLAHLAENPSDAIRVEGDAVHIKDLTVVHPEAADLVRAQLDAGGPEVAADFVRRGLPVGLVSLQMSSSIIDAGSVTRTLNQFASNHDASAIAAIGHVEDALARVKMGEQAITESARLVLGTLPDKVEAALAGQSESVRNVVVEAARSVQDTGMQQLNAALERFETARQRELSLDREGPLLTLRNDVVEQVTSTRRELNAQLTEVRALVEAFNAAKTAGAKSSRAVGAQVERDVLALCNDIVTAAGDLFEETGTQAGVNGRRTGDGVATLSELLTGPNRKVRIVLEAKSRTKPMSAKALRDEAARACATREADGALIVVPTRAEVPGETSVCRLDTTSWVVAADGDIDVVSWCYRFLREQVTLLARRVDNDNGVDLAQVEARITAALQTIGELDEVGRSAGLARNHIDKVLETGKRTQQRVRESLTDALTVMRA